MSWILSQKGLLRVTIIASKIIIIWNAHNFWTKSRWKRLKGGKRRKRRIWFTIRLGQRTIGNYAKSIFDHWFVVFNRIETLLFQDEPTPMTMNPCSTKKTRSNDEPDHHAGDDDHLPEQDRGASANALWGSWKKSRLVLKKLLQKEIFFIKGTFWVNTPKKQKLAFKVWRK